MKALRGELPPCAKELRVRVGQAERCGYSSEHDSPTMSFPAGAQRRGRESIAPRLVVDPLPSLALAGDDTTG
ncbi:hypothetical protein SAMN02927923_01489 [Microvirga guangxiensis]|uniref:Uncharacterized protein n=1 Tax=Microvirga guangxiensis TaxID=549386 RepID=A0A1G5GFT9_9HYPH|nr:hypothetical protein SAMN02927923_01489 [Microvirga guangxiensis]